MENNIDKDIEILKEFKEKGFASLMIKYNKDRIQTNTMVERALENVLSKLETYKKIAEFLAGEVKRDVVYYNTDGFDFCELSYEENYEKNGKCTKYSCGENCIQCIIDWARNEVEKDD